MPLEKLPSAWKKRYADIFDLKAFQIHCGIPQLQAFLESMEELDVIVNPTDVKVRVVPGTEIPKIPQCYSNISNFDESPCSRRFLQTDIPPPPLGMPPVHSPASRDQYSLSLQAATGVQINRRSGSGFSNSPLRRVFSQTYHSLPANNKQVVVPPPPPPRISPTGVNSMTAKKDSSPSNINFQSNRLQILKNLGMNTRNDFNFSQNSNLSQHTSGMISPILKKAMSSTIDNSSNIKKSEYVPLAENEVLAAPVVTRMQLHKMLFELIVLGCERQMIRWLKGEDLVELEEEEQNDLNLKEQKSKLKKEGKFIDSDSGAGLDSDSDIDSDGECDNSSDRLERRRRKKREKKEKKAS